MLRPPTTVQGETGGSSGVRTRSEAVNLARMTSPPPPGSASPRARLLLAGGITALLAVLVAAVLLLTGEEKKHEFDPAPTAGVTSWNKDSTALLIGQHQATAHRYSQVEVVRFGPDNTIVPGDDAGAPCGLIFDSSSLDSELAAAALVQHPKS